MEQNYPLDTFAVLEPTVPAQPTAPPQPAAPAQPATPAQPAAPAPTQTPPVLDFPIEVLSEIFLQSICLQRRTLEHDINTNAVTLLRLSHVCERFRHVALNDPSLWARVPYLNGVGEEFLQLMLSRSYPLRFSLSCIEDVTLPDSQAIWDMIENDFWRVSRLRVRVAKDFPGNLVEYFLGLWAPCLEHCYIDFQGDRHVALDSLIPPQFFESPPPLRDLHLVNCYISPDHSSNLSPFNRLRDVRIKHRGQDHGESPFLLSASDLSDWKPHFSSLHTLYLVNCVQISHIPSAMNRLELRSLKRFVLEGPTDVCLEMALVLRLPHRCSRLITVMFPLGGDAPHPARDASVALQFVPSTHRFSHCLIDLENPYLRPGLRLSGPDNNPVTVLIRFNLYQIKQRSNNTLHYLSRFPSFLATGLYQPEQFLRRLWEHLADLSTLHLHRVTTVALSLEHRSLDPSFLVGMLKNMQSLRTVVISGQAPGVWSKPWIRRLLHPSYLPHLTELCVPFDATTSGKAMGSIQQVVLQWTMPCKVTFRVPARYAYIFGYAAEEEIRNAIRELTRSYSPDVPLDWFWAAVSV